MDLYVDAAGEGAPVVFVHAGICDSRMWEPQWAAFTAAYRAVRLDLRGFGRSPLPPEPYSHGRDLVALLERLGTGPVALVAASYGGGVALEVAVARPDLVAALALADAALPGHAWSDEVKASWAEEEARLPRHRRATPREIHDSRHATIAAAAHLPSLERPDVFNDLALDFLGKHLRR